MGWDVVEARIRDAMEAGAFDNLSGAGMPLRDRLAEQFAGDQWMGFKILQNGGMLPGWLELAREIEVELEKLQRIDAEHALLVDAAAATGAWDAYAPAIQRARERFETAARTTRHKQDRFNLDAPGPAGERPGLWVDYHLARLDRRLADAGAPSEGAGPLSFI